jgi:hypothetical protein
MARPLNPISALTLVIAFPFRTFERLTERPHWVVPLVFVAAASMLKPILAVGGGYMEEILASAAFRTGVHPTEMEGGFVSFAVVTALVAIPLAAVVETLFYKLAGTLAGGYARFRIVLSAVAHASIPLGIGALAFAILLPFTKSLYAGANLAFLIDAGDHPILWSLLSQIDLFSMWFLVLLGIAAEPVFGLPRRRARAATLVFALFYIGVMTWWGAANAVRTDDPFEGWKAMGVNGSAMHFAPDTPEPVLEGMAAVIAEAEFRASSATGITDPKRIDYFVYPSFGEKRRITDVGTIAHRVEWANAIHVAWADGVETTLTREVTNLRGAQKFGNVYSSLIRDGLAIYAGGEWGAMPLAQAGEDLRARRVLPPLEVLVDPVRYVGVNMKLSQPAAGAFVAFFAAEKGLPALREIYAATTEQPESARELIEAAFGDSLGGIERRFLGYLESAGSAAGDR